MSVMDLQNAQIRLGNRGKLLRHLKFQDRDTRVRHQQISDLRPGCVDDLGEDYAARCWWLAGSSRYLLELQRESGIALAM
jgi:hypothetical protein